jgi:hypothetical protein
LFGNAAERKALGPGHPLVAHHDQAGALLFGDLEDRVGRVALARVRLSRDPGVLECLGTFASTLLTSARGLTIHCMSSGAWRRWALSDFTGRARMR